MNAKRKGNRGELELLHILQENGFPDAHRNDQMFSGGAGNPDLAATFRGIQLHVEVKRQEKLRLSEAINQAVTDAQGKAFPVVIHRTNRKPWLVTFRLDDFLLLAGEEARERRD